MENGLRIRDKGKHMCYFNLKKLIFKDERMKKEEERPSKAGKNMGLSHEMLYLVAQRSVGDDRP